MKKLLLAMLGILGALAVLTAFVSSRKGETGRRGEVRREDAYWFCYPGSN